MQITRKDYIFTLDEQGISVYADDYHAGEFILDEDLEKLIYEHLKKKYEKETKTKDGKAAV
jgi:hypothetical protein